MSMDAAEAHGFRRWFIFGESGDTVDLSDGEADVLQKIDRDLARKIIAARNRYCDSLNDYYEKCSTMEQ
jgi:hypothetical protein